MSSTSRPHRHPAVTPAPRDYSKEFKLEDSDNSPGSGDMSGYFDSPSNPVPNSTDCWWIRDMMDDPLH